MQKGELFTQFSWLAVADQMCHGLVTMALKMARVTSQ
jgi:hypothetical protein